jgi:hypothetical protein
MVALGISESVRFLVNQLGWDRFIFSNPPTYRNLTLEFLSAFRYERNRGNPSHGGLVSFRLFGKTYRLTTREIADYLGVPCGPDAFTEVQDDTFMESELKRYWGSISGNPNSSPDDRFSTEIHNPAIRYLHMIIAYTFLGKPVNDQSVTREELFIMFCGSQNRPINAAAFFLDNLANFTQDPTRQIGIGGFVTILARALDLHTPLSQIVLSVSVESMGIHFCFNNHMIGNLGPDAFQLLIDFQPIHEFFLPNNERTSVHDKKNWLYDLEDNAETDPETPPLYYILTDPKPPAPLFYYTPAPPSPAHTAASTTVPPPQSDHTAAIAVIQDELTTLRADFTGLKDELTTIRTDFHGFMDLAIAQFDRCSDEIRRIQPDLAETPPRG